MARPNMFWRKLVGAPTMETKAALLRELAVAYRRLEAKEDDVRWAFKKLDAERAVTAKLREQLKQLRKKQS